MELVKNYDSIKIAKKQKLKINYEKVGAYGQTNPTSAIDNNQTYMNQNMLYTLTINQDAIIKKQVTWFLVTKDDERRPVKADKAGFMKLYPQHSADIKQFLKTKKDGLRNLESIKQLLVICFT